LQREVWDFANTPEDRYPLLLYYHPLVIHRHQVIKQADVVLAMFLLGDNFSMEQKQRNFDYYDPITTGDSSLSVSIQGIIACELGYLEKAREYTRYAALMDLADIGGNVRNGAHLSSIGGTWMAVVYGFAGMRDYDGQLSFRPQIPEALEGFRFPLTIHGQELEVHIEKDQVTYLLRKGSELLITHWGEDIVLSVGEPCIAKLKPRAEEQ
jgi:alpha,alpha-trehalose phosphorylase